MSDDEDLQPFRLPTRSQTDEHTIKSCMITPDTTVEHLKKFLIGEFKAGEVMKAVWGREIINFDNDSTKIFDIISELKERTNGVFKETATLVATFNFIGGRASHK